MLIYLYAFAILALVLGAHMLGIDGLYVTIPGYDIMMHLLGGVGIGLFFVGLLTSYKSGALLRPRNVIFGVIIAGIVWEYFEIHFKITGHPLWTKLYYIDTVKDLINDTIGGACVAYVYKNRTHHVE